MFFFFTQAENEQNLQLLSEKDARVTQNEATIREKADEIKRLADAVSRWVHRSGLMV